MKFDGLNGFIHTILAVSHKRHTHPLTQRKTRKFVNVFIWYANSKLLLLKTMVEIQPSNIHTRAWQRESNDGDGDDDDEEEEAKGAVLGKKMNGKWVSKSNSIK